MGCSGLRTALRGLSGHCGAVEGPVFLGVSEVGTKVAPMPTRVVYDEGMDITTALWANDNGRIACPTHGGHYLQTAIEAKPRAKRHSTPLGTWELMTPADITYFAHEVGVNPTCENCRG